MYQDFSKCTKISQNLPRFLKIYQDLNELYANRDDRCRRDIFSSINPCNYSPYSRGCHIILTCDMSSSILIITLI